MKKKWISALLSGWSLLFLAGCGSTQAAVSAVQPAMEPTPASVETAESVPKEETGSTPAPLQKDEWRTLDEEEMEGLWDSLGGNEAEYVVCWVAKDDPDNKIALLFARDPESLITRIGYYQTDNVVTYRIGKITTDDDTCCRIFFSEELSPQEEIDEETLSPVMEYEPVEEETSMLLDLGEAGDGMLELVGFEPAGAFQDPYAYPGILYAV